MSLDSMRSLDASFKRHKSTILLGFIIEYNYAIIRALHHRDVFTAREKADVTLYQS